MKVKNGFIFVETIVVLTVTMVSLMALYGSYILVMKSAENKKYYDNINDVYKVNIAKKMLLTNPANGIYPQNKCINIMQSDCTGVLEGLGVTHVIITDTDSIRDLTRTNHEVMKNSFKRYLQILSTREKNSKFIIIVRDEDGKKHYASLKYGG